MRDTIEHPFSSTSGKNFSFEVLYTHKAGTPHSEIESAETVIGEAVGAMNSSPSGICDLHLEKPGEITGIAFSSNNAFRQIGLVVNFLFRLPCIDTTEAKVFCNYTWKNK
jgi:hypothetical protein